MPETVWYRSIYWRIAFGFVALLAVLLGTQALVFLWMTGRMSELVPGRSPAELAQTIALDLERALPENPALNLDEYLNSRYSSLYRGWVVVTRDNRAVFSRVVPPMPNAAGAVRGRLFDRDRQGPPPPNAGSDGGASGGPPAAGSTPAQPAPQTQARPSRDQGAGTQQGGSDQQRDQGGRGGGRRGGFGRGGRGGGPGGPGGPGGGLEYAPVLINGEPFAMVGVPIDPPPLWLAVQNIGPTLAIAAVGLLVTGAVVGAFIIFAPSRRRMRSLQDAARALGRGETGARAVATGGDEVTELARAFNDMASNLEQRTSALVAADESRRRLLADVSHELMTPLAAIRGYVETMAMDGVRIDDPTRRRYLGIVGDETERMEHIIGDLLDLARVEGGGGQWKREPVSLASLFERVEQRHGPILRARGIRMTARVSSDAATVVGDPNRLEQVLQNLAANAVRHTPAGGSVTLSTRGSNGDVEIDVEDSGPGVPEEHLPHIFDRFYKVDSARTGTDVPSGSGLGLSIVQAIVHRHGGRIAAANAPGGGARFTVTLPAG